MERDLTGMGDDDYEKTMIEAGVLLITLLFIIVSLPNLPKVRPLGDLFATACLFVFGVLVATCCMFFSPPTIADDTDIAALRVTGRAIVFFSFIAGLGFLAIDFFQLAEALNTTTDLASVFVELGILAIIVFAITLVYQRRKRAKSDRRSLDEPRL